MSKLSRASIAVLAIGLLSAATRLDVADLALGNEGDDRCPVAMVRVGPLCVDKFEATVWSRSPTRDGEPRGVEFGLTGDDYPCSFNGDDCRGEIFAASLRGRIPAGYITWFQAQQACFNVGKRLPTNGEWHAAAAGTPTDYEPGADNGRSDCNTSTADEAVRTGSRSRCVSDSGIHDMVGNMLEWTADWIQGNVVPFTPSEGTAGAEFGDDFMRGVNPAVIQGFGTNFPAALVRGGGFEGGSGAGVFALNARFGPGRVAPDGGFRCVL